MSFDVILADLVKKVPGAAGAVFVDWEGEAISSYPPENKYDLLLCGAYQGIVYKLVNLKIRDAALFGGIREIYLEHEKARFFLYPVLKDYLLVVILQPNALTYTAHRFAELAVDRLIDEIGPE